MFASAIIVIVAVTIMLSNFRISKSREKEWEAELGVARMESTTDPLTGVKNKHAYMPSVFPQSGIALYDSGKHSSLITVFERLTAICMR